MKNDEYDFSEEDLIRMLEPCCKAGKEPMKTIRCDYNLWKACIDKYLEDDKENYE